MIFIMLMFLIMVLELQKYIFFLSKKAKKNSRNVLMSLLFFNYVIRQTY